MSVFSQKLKKSFVSKFDYSICVQRLNRKKYTYIQVQYVKSKNIKKYLEGIKKLTCLSQDKNYEQ